MTIQEAIDRCDLLKPNAVVTEAKIAWLSSLDQQIYNELVLTHEHDEDAAMPAYAADTDKSTALLVPEPYSDVYVYYLHTQIDNVNEDYSKSLNDTKLYNNAYLTLSDYWTRTHMPLTAATHFHL